MINFLVCLFAASSAAFAGGVETRPEEVAVLQRDDIVADGGDSISPSPFGSSTVYLKYQDTVLQSTLLPTTGAAQISTWQSPSWSTMEGGVETLTLQSPSFQAMGVIRQAVETLELEKVRYAGETDGAVLVMVNDSVTQVEISDSELSRAPEVEMAIRQSYETSEWSHLQ